MEVEKNHPHTYEKKLVCKKEKLVCERAHACQRRYRLLIALLEQVTALLEYLDSSLNIIVEDAHAHLLLKLGITAL